MPHRLQFTCPLSAGLHARPASRLAEIARGFAATCQLTNIRSGARADAKSVLAILAADIGAGDACDLEVSGGDEQVAAVEMEHFLRAELSAYEEEDPPPVETETTLFLPLALARSGARWWRGRAVSPGVGLGRVFTPVAAAFSTDMIDEPVSIDLADERRKLERALEAVRTRIEARLAHRASVAEAAILAAHAAIVTDPLLRAALVESIEDGRSAAAAIVAATERFTASIAGARTPALRERAADVQGI